jgi:hypothetical protein
MSATLLDTGAGAALEAASHGTGAGGGKASMQDFHFVMRATAGQGAGKVSMNDLLASATAGQGGGGAGKVSMQDFHFVIKHNSASPSLT